jgi:plasmid maintenance system antidote protein VapI
MAKKLKPIHPGEQLREEFMLPLGLSSNALARAISVTPTDSVQRLPLIRNPLI